ncbi:MAG: type II toxin-antitoxin system HipA family toxin, partial [Bilifractor porci]
VWKLAPAYDLTFSTTAYNEHTTSVNYNGRNPGKKELLEIASENGILKAKAAEIIDQIHDFVKADLNEYVNDL